MLLLPFTSSSPGLFSSSRTTTSDISFTGESGWALIVLFLVGVKTIAGADKFRSTAGVVELVEGNEIVADNASVTDGNGLSLLELLFADDFLCSSMLLFLDMRS